MVYKEERASRGMRKQLALLAVLLTATGVARAGIVHDLGNAFSDHIMGALAEGKGSMANQAKQHMKQREIAKKEANRGPRKTVAECMKPGNVIDDDVNECVKGYREKTW